MSILRAKTQMIKHRERLFSKIEEAEKKKVDLDQVIEALKAQIAGIDAAMDAIAPEATYKNPHGN